MLGLRLAANAATTAQQWREGMVLKDGVEVDSMRLI